jgi:quercetin dioxygenase-like cupin family protein
MSEPALQDRIVDDPVLRQRYAFRRVERDGREVQEVEVWVDPGGGVLPHIHPTFEERFLVHEGEVTFWLGRKRQTAGAGETVVVPAGARHDYRNRSDAPAHMTCTATPPLPALQGFLEDAAALARTGGFTRQGMPTGWRALLQAAVMLRHYRDDVLILRPPPFVQRLLLDPLARRAERRGYRAQPLAAP